MTDVPPPGAEATESATPAGVAPGNADIDAALATMEVGPDVHTHPEQIAAVLDAVARALQTSPPAAGR